MSSLKTDKLQLNKWVPTDYVNMNEFNDNFQKIDDAHKDVTTQLADDTTKIKRDSIYQFGIPRTIRNLYEGKPIRVVVGGHSLAYGSGAGDKNLDWQGLVKANLAKRFPNSSITWTNSAVGGTSSTHLRDNWETLVTPYNPSLIIIAHGTNDQTMSNAQRADNYAFFAQKAKELDAEVLLITDSTVMMTPAPYGNTPDQNVVRREEVSEQTREFARQYKFGLVDPHLTWRKWLTDRGLTVDSTLLLYDHIHFNDLGHKMVAYEVLMAFNANTDAARELDERYGGKGYGLFGKLTFRDFALHQGIANGWGIYDLDNQLVDWGGLWWVRDYLNNPIKKAKLYGTQAVTGDEPYLNNYQKTWHIIPRDKDYIELEVKDAKRVWFSMNGDSATPTTFSIKVDGVEVQTLDVSNTSNTPVEVSFNTSGLKVFRKGNHKVRVERVGTIPSTNYVEFHGFLVKYYEKDEPEQFNTVSAKIPQSATPTIAYQTLDTTVATRQEASDIGIVAPFGYQEFDGGWIQLKTKQPAVLKWDFYGDVLKLRLKNLTTDNYVSVYVDGILKENVNLKDAVTGSSNVRTYTGLGFNKKHTVYVIAINAEINLTGVRASDTVA